MKIFIFLTMIILIIYTSKVFVNRTKKAAFLKAGKKWEGIVKELSERK